MLTRVRLGTVGYATLLLSNLVLLASGGLLLLALFWRVIRTARTASATPRSSGPRLVLGHVLQHGRPSLLFIQRLRRAIALQRLAPHSPILLLGGRTSAGAPSEAEAGRDYLLEAGVPAARLVIEDGSRHTLENLQQARRLIPPEPRPVLISNRFHLHRCGVSARALGLDVELCAAEPEGHPAQWLRMLMEAYLLHWFHVGRCWSRLTGNRRALARIS